MFFTPQVQPNNDLELKVDDILGFDDSLQIKLKAYPVDDMTFDEELVVEIL